MKKNIRNLAFMILASLMPLIYIAGCKKVSYDKADEDKIIEYAVNAVLNHDRNYIVKMPERKTEPETEPTTVWISDDNQGGSNGETPNGNSGNSTGKPQPAVVSANEGFGLSGFTVTEAGYEVADRYPAGNDGFSMVALNKNKLLVLKFNVTNNSNAQAALDMMGKNLSYRCLINNNTGVNVQVTALLNGLNTYNGTFEAGESKEMVLVFQINEEVSANINNISLYVAKDSKTSVIAIKK